MTTLTWLFFILSFCTGFYIAYRITKWKYRGKIAKLERQIKSSQDFMSKNTKAHKIQ